MSELTDLPELAKVPKQTLQKSYSLDDLRRDRDIELLASDWTQSADSPLSDDDKAKWAAYRQALRDVTSLASIPQPGFPNWPTPPSA
jgi:hypothetical protein